MVFTTGFFYKQASAAFETFLFACLDIPHSVDCLAIHLGNLNRIFSTKFQQFHSLECSPLSL